MAGVAMYNFEYNIMPVPYFSPNGQMFSYPEWAGFYPLYITAAEANERSPQTVLT